MHLSHAVSHDTRLGGQVQDRRHQSVDFCEGEYAVINYKTVAISITDVIRSISFFRVNVTLFEESFTKCERNVTSSNKTKKTYKI